MTTPNIVRIDIGHAGHGFADIGVDLEQFGVSLEELKIKQQELENQQNELFERLSAAEILGAGHTVLLDDH